MITNCGPLVLRHDAKGPQVLITTGGPSPVLVPFSIRSRSRDLGAHITIRLEPVPEPVAPARPSGLPVQVSFRRVVRGAADLGHHRHRHLARGQPGQPDRQVPGLPAHRAPAPGTAATPPPRRVRRRPRCRHLCRRARSRPPSPTRHRPRGRTTRPRCPRRPAGICGRGPCPRTSPTHLARTASRTAAPDRASGALRHGPLEVADRGQRPPLRGRRRGGQRILLGGDPAAVRLFGQPL